MVKRLRLVPWFAAFLVLLAANESAAESMRVVVDMAGNPTLIPTEARKIACLEVLCYEKIFLLGAADRIEMMTRTNAPWMPVTNLDVTRIQKLSSEPNIEELLRRRVDVAFRTLHYPSSRTIEYLTAAGVPVLVSQPVGRPSGAHALEEFIESRKRMLRLFARVLGPEFEPRAEAWCDYFDSKVAYVRARTRDIPEDSRIRLYHVRGPAVTRTHGARSWGQTYWYGVLAGARMVIENEESPFAGGFADVSLEALLAWNPQVINVGRLYSARMIMEDPRLARIEAVRTGRVYELPEGVFYWDGSTEGILLMLYLAKQLYPERFPDLDLRQEIREYYARFYRHALSEGEIDLMLAGKGPDGRRVNDMNN
jgi:iron complex transport system substrate-binding protein